MVTRTSSKQVIFRRPFLLGGLDGMQPAGTYTIDTEEERVDALSFSAWKRVATVMQLARGGATEYQPIDPAKLSEALRRDGASLDAPSPSLTSLAARHEGARPAMNELRTQGR
jgi:hypothetical protein